MRNNKRCGSCQYSKAKETNGRVKQCQVHNEQVSSQRTACHKYTARTPELNYREALNELVGGDQR